MWSDAQILLVILAALYASECLVWVPAQCMLASRPARRWRARSSDGGFGNRRGALLPASFLPHAHAALLWSPWGFSCDEHGAVSFCSDQPGQRARPSQPGVRLTWSEVAALTRHGNLLLHRDETFLRATGVAAARRSLQLLHALASAPSAERPEAIRRAVRETLDPERLAPRLEELRRVSRPVTRLAVLAFLVCFVGGPAATLAYGVDRALPPVFAVALGLHAVLVAVFWRAHWRLLPASAGGARGLELLKVSLSPPMAMRAPTTLWLQFLAGTHPLALLAAEGEDEEFRALARSVLTDLRHPLDESDCPAPAREMAASFRRLWAEEISRLLVARGLSEAGLLRDSRERPPEERFLCPRCRTGFQHDPGGCPDCRMPLQPRSP